MDENVKCCGMELKIQTWIRRAGKISKKLLENSEIQSDDEVYDWMNTSERGKRIVEELGDPNYYAIKAAQKKEIEERYTWEGFVAWRKNRERRRKLQIVRYAAGVAVVIGVGVGVWLSANREQEATSALVSKITPGGPKASLILADGQEISLIGFMTLAEADSSVVLSNKEGELSYRNVRDVAGKECMNTLRVPCGGEYQLMLSDGTKVRLNSESELIFPARFSSDKREVLLKGEAYFEVARDLNKPFYVKVHDYAVKVTGTTFNVASYADDPCTTTTLVEGSVSVVSNDSTWNCDLTPGHVLMYYKETAQAVSQACDPILHTSWIDGEFKFRDMRLEDIMKKLNRWYDFQVQYEEEALKDLRFSGAAEKYNPVEFLLRMIESVTRVRFDIREKQIVIKKN